MVVLAGTVAVDPVQRRMPSGDEVDGNRLSSTSRTRDQLDSWLRWSPIVGREPRT